MDELIAAWVPDPEDRLDLDAVFRPMEGQIHADRKQLRACVRAHINKDLDRYTMVRQGATEPTQERTAPCTRCARTPGCSPTAACFPLARGLR
ncbi:hypothetical protein ACFYPT_37655 [Streptomyces sp. NPDC005529]|uniref:hypothetical protein n=1 Tax=unclassified Streptomyces TaxID=2593676 RepID=UPI0033AEF4D8